MVQDQHKDYDIDDGVYFHKDDLQGPKGGEKTALDAKKMVRKALHDDRFKMAPEVRTNCVRVYYNVGYHVDVPVYRIVTTTSDAGEDAHYEIAGSDWKQADPLEVTRWFERENTRQSPDDTNGRQLRRQTRLNKAFARSRESWKARIASGFTITTLLIEECYRKDGTREDRALYDTMLAIRDRLEEDLEVAHPTVDGEMLTSGNNDARTKFFREKLDWAIGELQVLFEPGCTREQALKAWDKVFDTTFFHDRLGDDQAEKKKSASVAASLLIMGSERAAPSKPVQKRGGGRYA